VNNRSSILAVAPWLVAAGLAAGASDAVRAQQPAPPVTTMQTHSAPGTASAMGTHTITATVVEVDPATRNVTLKAHDGRVVTLNASNEVRNFDQIKVGDKLTAQYSIAISLDLHKSGTAMRHATEKESMTRSEPGAKPGGSIARQVQVMADVVKVDHKNKVVTLRGPRGNMVDLAVEDPEQLKNIKKGDQVQAVYTEAVVISMEAQKK